MTAASLSTCSCPCHRTRLLPFARSFSSASAAISSVLSQIVDTLIFITVAFYGVFPIGQLVVGQMLAKVTLSIVLVPPLIYAFVGLGRRLDRTR